MAIIIHRVTEVRIPRTLEGPKMGGQRSDWSVARIILVVWPSRRVAYSGKKQLVAQIPLQLIATNSFTNHSIG